MASWQKVKSNDGALLYWESPCAGYRVIPLYSNRWHACERLMPDGSWLEWAGKERLLDAMSVCGRHAQCAAESSGPAPEPAES